MFPLSHLGIGSVLTRPFAKRLPFRWILLGTLLPDLIDKPFYFSLGVIEHFRTGGWVPGKRGVAHTLIFLALLGVIAVWRRSPSWAAVAVGDATHLVLDFVSKISTAPHAMMKVTTVLLWPFMGWGFPTLAFGMHGMTMLILEGIGAALLITQLSVKGFRPQII